MGVGEAARDAKLMDGANPAISPQSPVRSRLLPALRSPSHSSSCAKVCPSVHTSPAWRPHVGIPDRLVTLALPPNPRLPRPLDRQFDGNGNYTFGLTEQSMFHEIDQDSIDRVRGMDITVVTSAKTDDEAAILKALGFPFKTSNDYVVGPDPLPRGRETTTRKRAKPTMTMIDPVADMLTRLRNANSAYHDTVSMPYSKLKSRIAEILG